MSYDLCRIKTAEKPFYLENISTYIYSIEELCFFLHNNIYLIDSTVIGEPLCDWLRDELGLRTLYRQLYEQLGRAQEESGEGEVAGSAAASFVLPIFREIGYLSPREMKSYQDTLSKLAVQPEDMRDKLKGDYLTRSGMYGNAVNEYLQILERRGPGSAGAQFYAQVLDNLGCAYARLFRFEEAADAFYRAWKMARSKDSLRRYVSVLPLYLPERTCERCLKELDADETAIESIKAQNLRTAKARARKLAREEASQTQPTMEELTAQLAQLQKQYRRFSNRNAKE